MVQGRYLVRMVPRFPPVDAREHTMRKATIMTMTAGTLIAGAAAVAVNRTSSAERDDCPGKIICPATGELICADQCPLDAAAVSLPIAAEPECCSAASTK